MTPPVAVGVASTATAAGKPATSTTTATMATTTTTTTSTSQQQQRRRKPSGPAAASSSSFSSSSSSPSSLATEPSPSVATPTRFRWLAAFAANSAAHLALARVFRPSTMAEHFEIAKVLSTVHALNVFSRIHPLLYPRAGDDAARNPWRVDWVRPYPLDGDRALADHIGFTLYDLAMMTAVKGVHATVWIHHIMGVYGSGAMRHFRIAAYLPEVFFPTEITVVPTNLLSHLDGMFPTSAAAASAAKGKANRGPAERTVISGALDPRVVFHIRTVLLVVRCVLFTMYRLPSLYLAIRGMLRAEQASYLEEQTLALGDERPAPRPLTGWKLYARLWKRYWALPPIVSVLSALNMMTLGAFNVWWTVLVFKALARHLRSGRNVGTGVHHI